MVDLNRTAYHARKAARKRAEKGQLRSDTFGMLKHCAGEVVEAADAYSDLVLYNEDSVKEQFADELADIITCALIVAAQEEIDIEAALSRVQEKNDRRAEE